MRLFASHAGQLAFLDHHFSHHCYWVCASSQISKMHCIFLRVCVFDEKFAIFLCTKSKILWIGNKNWSFIIIIVLMIMIIISDPASSPSSCSQWLQVHSTSVTPWPSNQPQPWGGSHHSYSQRRYFKQHGIIVFRYFQCISIVEYFSNISVVFEYFPDILSFNIFHF